MLGQQDKYCPLYSTGQPRPVPCRGDACAWYLTKPSGSNEISECALTCLAKQISIIAKR